MIVSDWAARARKHHVTQVIGSDVNTILPNLHHPLATDWASHLHGVACNSQALESRFFALFPHARNVRTIHRGVDLELFSPVGAEMGPLAHKKPVRFAYFGGFRCSVFPRRGTDIKGGLTLLSAWKEAEPQLPVTASLLLAGPDVDKAVIRSWKHTLRDPARVHVVGRIAPTEIPAYLRAADVILVPSQEEGLPNICVEAAGCGRAVFGSDAGGIPETVQDGVTGLILRRSDVNSWRESLVSYSRQVDLVRDMGQRGRTRVLNLFDATAYAPKMFDLYQAALRLPLEGPPAPLTAKH
jgi:glycosyltransferase involved in cell wall biosynthesis